MKKLTLKKKLNELGKYLKSDAATGALKTLENELASYEEPSSNAVEKDFLIPAEVASDPNNLALYTDGACRGNPGPGSYGFLIQDWNGAIVETGADFDEHTTNNKMELLAVIRGLEVLYEIKDDLNEVHIYTDSKYVVEGMNSWVKGWKSRGWKKADKKVPENVELWKSLDLLREQKKCLFHWVKGHSGHPQNEFVDQLANIALDENGF